MFTRLPDWDIQAYRKTAIGYTHDIAAAIVHDMQQPFISSLCHFFKTSKPWPRRLFVCHKICWCFNQSLISCCVGASLEHQLTRKLFPLFNPQSFLVVTIHFPVSILSRHFPNHRLKPRLKPRSINHFQNQNNPLSPTSGCTFETSHRSMSKQAQSFIPTSTPPLSIIKKSVEFLLLSPHALDVHTSPYRPRILNNYLKNCRL